MKKLILLVVVLFLGACDQKVSQNTTTPVAPKVEAPTTQSLDGIYSNGEPKDNITFKNGEVTIPAIGRNPFTIEGNKIVFRVYGMKDAVVFTRENDGSIDASSLGHFRKLP